MNIRRLQTLVTVVMVAVSFLGLARRSSAEKPTVLAPCNQCHQPQKDVVQGTLVSISDKFKTISVQVGSKLV